MPPGAARLRARYAGSHVRLVSCPRLLLLQFTAAINHLLPSWRLQNEAGVSNADAFAVRFYDSINVMKHSDHRPVAASFTVRLRGSTAATHGAAAGTATAGSVVAASNTAISAASGAAGGVAAAGMPVSPPAVAGDATINPISVAAASIDSAASASSGRADPAVAGSGAGSGAGTSGGGTTKPPVASASKRLCCWLAPRRSGKVAPAPPPPATVTVSAKP